MLKILTMCLGVALLLAVTGCKQGGGDSMGSMKMNGDNSMSPPATMPATMPADMK
jgi:hypothetical protein